MERMKKLDSKIKELEEAVTIAHETSDAFSEETLKEQVIFQHAKRSEMKEMFGALADGQIEMYRAVRPRSDRYPVAHFTPARSQCKNGSA